MLVVLVALCGDDSGVSSGGVRGGYVSNDGITVVMEELELVVVFVLIEVVVFVMMEVMGLFVMTEVVVGVFYLGCWKYTYKPPIVCPIYRKTRHGKYM